MLSNESILELEKTRNSRVLVLAASNLEIELLPELYRVLRSLDKVKRLDVLIYSRGGVVNGVRRLAMILREYCEHLTFIVPHYCESSATLLCLAGDEIIASSTAIFSPIDPQLQSQGSDEHSTPVSISSQDVRLFRQVMSDWFELNDAEASVQAVQQIGQGIFPTTLTSFYRATKELEEIGMQLLTLSLPKQTTEFRASIVNNLIYGYHSHSYAICGEELLQLGLNVSRDDSVEELAWRIVERIHSILGPGNGDTASWCDAIIAISDCQMSRWRNQNNISADWKESHQQ